jgi:RNA polymerase sigma-70 factor (ECF subfamily)
MPKTPATTEQDLVLRLRQGDRRAFEELYDNYSGALYGILKKILKDDEKAQDVLQEAFVKIWRNIQAYDAGKGRLFTWLLNVSRNLAIDALRRKETAQANQTDSLDDYVYIGDNDPTPLALPDLDIIQKRIRRMRPEQQQVLELVYFQGYTHSEVAETLNIPLGTAKTRIHTAINELRAHLNGINS